MTKSDKIREILSSKKWSWWGQRAHDALGLNYLLDLDFLVCCDWGEDIGEIWQQDKVISLELETGERGNFSNEDLNYAVKGKFKSRILDKIAPGTNCIMYRSLKEVERLAMEKKTMRICSAPLHLKDTFDNKILFRKIIRELGLNLIPGEVLELASNDYRNLSKKWGRQFVIQYPVGSSGAKTHLIEDSGQYESIKNLYPEEPVILQKYLEGYSVNINGVVSEEKIRLSPISVQVIGVPLLVSGKFGFAGNDFSSANNIPESVKENIFEASRKIGGRMADSGFRGMMGIDMMISGETVYPVEINPRFQNSTSLLTLVEIEKKSVPLVIHHLAEFDNSIKSCIHGEPVSIEDINGSQLILHNLEKNDINITNPLRPGIYEQKDNKLVFKRPGFSVLDCKKGEEFALCGGIPGKGTVLKPGAPLVKLHFKEKVVDETFRNFRTKIELIIKNIYNNLIGENYGT